MPLRRFYCEDLGPDEVALDDEQARHARRVLRVTPGDRVELFDGRGHAAAAQVLDRAPGVHVRITDRHDAPRPNPIIDLATAVPKGDRAAVLMEKASELGADRVIPLVTERSVVEPGGGKRKRFDRIALESAKQCGRPWVMEIDRPTELAALLRRADHDVRLIADTEVEGGAAGPPGLAALRPGAWGNGGVQDLPGGAEAVAREVRVLVLIGPEGGWTDEERRAAFSAGFAPWRLGPHVLRIETAALAALAILRARS